MKSWKFLVCRQFCGHIYTKIKRWGLLLPWDISLFSKNWLHTQTYGDIWIPIPKWIKVRINLDAYIYQVWLINSSGFQLFSSFLCRSVQFSHSVMSDSLWTHELQHARPPCPSPTPKVYSNSCPSSRWCHPAISSSVVPFSSCPQSLSASGSFQMSQLFTWGGQIIGVSTLASVLPMNTQDWSPLGWTGWISLQSKGLTGVFPNITVQKHQF